MKFVQSLVNVGAPQSESGAPQSVAPQFHEIIRKAIDKTEFVDVSSGGADAEFSIEHGMGVIPIGYLVISQDKPGVIYKSTTPWTESYIFLKSTVAGTVLRVLIF